MNLAGWFVYCKPYAGVNPLLRATSIGLSNSCNCRAGVFVDTRSNFQTSPLNGAGIGVSHVLVVASVSNCVSMQYRCELRCSLLVAEIRIGGRASGRVAPALEWPAVVQGWRTR